MSAKVYRDYTQEELDKQYEHRHIVPNMEEFTSRNQAEGKRMRETLPARLDVPYGPHPKQKLDIYTVTRARAPIAVNFHGGRWQLNSRELSAQAAEAFTQTGIVFVNAGFRQVPDFRMDQLIEDARNAVAWAYKNAESLGANPDRLFIVGQSSGAHMGGMMVVTDWTKLGLPRDAVKGGLLVSGMYDLEPVRLTFRNAAVKLDVAEAERNSPIRHIPQNGCPIVLGYGALESDEFKRQSRDFAAAWRKAGNPCELVEMPGHHHYSLGAEMNNPASAIVRPLFQLAGAAVKAAAE